MKPHSCHVGSGLVGQQLHLGEETEDRSTGQAAGTKDKGTKARVQAEKGFDR